MTFTNAEKAKEAQREAGLRQRVYPRFVAGKKISQAEADRQIALMQEIADDYRAKATAADKAESPELFG